MPILTMTIDRSVRDFFIEMAREKGVTVGELLSRGLAVIHLYREYRKHRETHLGFVSDPGKLDTVIIGL